MTGQLLKQCLGWCVHFYTSLGLVAAAGIVVCIVEGGPAAFHRAFALMLVATLIDATDGTLARAVRVKEVLPGFDGRRLDDLVDFLTYSFLPVLLLWRAGLLSPGQEAWLLAPLLASAYGFCQVSAKTDDGYFLGLPSYWNLVVFYLYTFHEYVTPLPSALVIGVLALLSMLTFVPTRYLYPSQQGRLNRITTLLGGIWALLLISILYRLSAQAPPAERTADSAGDPLTRGLLIGSLFFPLYYLAASWIVSFRRR